MYRLIKLLLLLVCLNTGVSFGQVGSISQQVVSQTGSPLPYAQVRICSATSTGTPCNPTTPIFYDYGLSNPAPNPITTDQYGNFTVFVPALPAPNLYTVQFSIDGGLTWSYVQDGPVNGSPTIQACNQVGADAGAQINAAGAKLPNGGVIDATCYGATEQQVNAQLTGVSGKNILLLLNLATTYQFNYQFSGTQISAAVATGNSGLTGACLVPIGNGSAIHTDGYSANAANFQLGPTAATYDFACNADMSGHQEAFQLNGLGIAGNASATMKGSLLHMRRVYASTIIQNVLTFAPYGNGLTDDGGSDQIFINDDFADEVSTGGYPGAVATFNCVANITVIGGAIQFNGANNPLLVINGSDTQLSECPLGSSSRGLRFYDVDFEITSASVGSFPGAPTNVDPIQMTDSGFIIMDQLVAFGNPTGSGQNHIVDILSSGNNGQLRGPIEINNISAPYPAYVGKSIIHNTNGSPYVSATQADVYGTINDSELVIGQYKWQGNGAASGSSIDYEDFKNFSNVVTGDLTTGQNPNYDIRFFGAVSGATDVTVPVQNAVTAAVITGGQIYFPPGVWNINGAINSACDAIICLPAVSPTSSAEQVKIHGATRNRQDAQGPNNVSGSLIVSTTAGTDASSAIFGVPTVSTPFGNNIDFYISDLTIRTKPNPNLGCINMYQAAGAWIDGIRCEIGENYTGTHTQPTNVATGITLPRTGNDTLSGLTRSEITGYYQGVNMSEHAYLNDTWVAFGIQGYFIEPSYNPLTGHFGCEEVATCIETVGGGQLDVDVAIELDPMNVFGCTSWCYSTTDIIDERNVINGLVRYYKSEANVGNITTPIAIDSSGLPPAATYYNTFTNQFGQLQASIFTSTGSMPTCTNVATNVTCTPAAGSTESRGYITFVTSANIAAATQLARITFGTPLGSVPFIQPSQSGLATWYGIYVGSDTTTTYFDLNNSVIIPSGTTLVVSYTGQR